MRTALATDMAKACMCGETVVRLVLYRHWPTVLMGGRYPHVRVWPGMAARSRYSHDGMKVTFDGLARDEGGIGGDHASAIVLGWLVLDFDLEGHCQLSVWQRLGWRPKRRACRQALRWGAGACPR